MLLRGIHGKDPGRSLGPQGLASRSMDWTVGQQQRHPLRACEKCRTSGPAPDLLNENLHFLRLWLISVHIKASEELLYEVRWAHMKYQEYTKRIIVTKTYLQSKNVDNRECTARNTLKIIHVLFIFYINMKNGRRGSQGELVLSR